MSGLNEILQWAETQGLTDFESVAEEFDKEGRLPLEEILGDQTEEFKERLEGFSGLIETESIDESLNPEFPELPEIQEEISISSEVKNQIKQVVTSFINFFRSN